MPRDGSNEARDRWNETLDRLRSGDTSAYAALNEIATSLGRAILARRFPTIPKDVRDDLIQDVMVSLYRRYQSWAPDRALFVVAVIRKALDYVRGPDEPPVGRSDDAGDDPIGQLPGSHNVEGEVLGRIELTELLARLSPRDRQIAVAVALGENRDDVAASFGTSRANIDQIMHRIRFKARAWRRT